MKTPVTLHFHFSSNSQSDFAVGFQDVIKLQQSKHLTIAFYLKLIEEWEKEEVTYESPTPKPAVEVLQCLLGIAEAT